MRFHEMHTIYFFKVRVREPNAFVYSAKLFCLNFKLKKDFLCFSTYFIKFLIKTCVAEMKPCARKSDSTYFYKR